MLGLMSVEQIQILIADAVKAQLGEGNRKMNPYRKLYTKRIDLTSPMAINHPNSTSSMEREALIEMCNNIGTKGDRFAKQFV